MAPEPPSAGRRHNGMLNTPSLYRRSARTGRTRFGAAAGLAIGGAMLAGGMLLAGCSGSSATWAASSSGSEAVPSGEAAVPGIAAPAAGPGRSAANQSASTGTTAQLAPASDIIYTAQLAIRAQNVGVAAARVSLSWTLAFLGAIAPFAALVAIAGYAIYRARRRVLRRRPGPRPAAPEN